MVERRQKPIPVTNQERALLEEQKLLYEKSTGDSGDWGKFLENIALLGLAALGIYAIAKATQRTQQSVDVNCAVCSKDFVMAVSTVSLKIVHTKCPYCQSELVVNLGNTQS